MENRVLSAKCRRIVEDNRDVLDYVLKEVIDGTFSKINADSEFDLLKKYYTNEGIKEGAKEFVRKLNEYASKLE